ncbi:MAG: NAD(P)-binding domain-containing protein, partial [Bacteroidota bacterium]|nr:NAD(P)-binding domain-containing protein [Bacteroidota bacterium]
MNIAIIGTGNVGGSLAEKWSKKGHQIFLGVRDIHQFKGQHLLSNPNIQVQSISEATSNAEVILLAIPAMAAVEVSQQLGDTRGKIIIDTMNIVAGRGPAGFANTSEAILAHTETRDVVKCFNSTGFNNMQ